VAKAVDASVTTKTRADPKAIRAAKPKVFLLFAVSKLSDLIPDLRVLNSRVGCCNGSQMNFSRREDLVCKAVRFYLRYGSEVESLRGLVEVNFAQLCIA
jgi:hypothetical protein